MEKRRAGVVVAIAVILIFIAVNNLWELGNEADTRIWFLMAAQTVATILAAMWIIDAPRFRDSIDLAEDLFGGSYPVVHEKYSRDICFFKSEVTGRLEGLTVEEREAVESPCDSFRKTRKAGIMFSKIALVVLWVVVGIMLLMYIHEVTHDGIAIAIFSLTALPAYAMNLISFYLCFVFTWHIVDVAKLASEGELPYSWSQPSKTPGYMLLSRVSKQLNVCFLIVSLLFASLILLLSLYSGTVITSSGDGVLFASCFVFTLLLGIVSFLYLHFVSRINLSVMLDSWEEQTWSKAMPVVSSEAVLGREEGRGDVTSLRGILSVHSETRNALEKVGERPGFDSVDAASLTLAFLTLVVAIATLFRP